MAQTSRSLTYGSKLTSTREKLHAKGVPQDAIFEAIPTLNLMRTKGGYKKKTSGGEVIRVNVMTDKNTLGKSITGLEPVTMGQTDPFTIAYAEWKEYIWPLVISGMLKFQNQGEEKIFDLLSELEQNLYMSAAEQINADLWDAANVSTANGTSGNGDKNITSIPMCAVPVPGTSNKLQGITTATGSNTWWQNKIADGGGSLTAITFVNKLDRLINLSNRGRTSGKADQIVFDQLSYELFESSMRDRVRYTSGENASAGFEKINHKGCDIMWDVYVPNVKTTAENGGPSVTLTKGTGYVLNSKAISLYCGKDFEPTPFMDGTYNGQDGMASLTVFIGQLVVSSRRNLGVFFDIPTSLSA